MRRGDDDAERPKQKTDPEHKGEIQKTSLDGKNYGILGVSLFHFIFTKII